MKKLWALAIGAFTLAALCSAMALAQPPEGQPGEGPPPREGGGPGVREGEPGPGHPRPRPWEPGKVMPPHVQHALELSTDQQKQIADLEHEVHDRIMKILTDEQKSKLKTLRPMGPPQGEGQGQGQGRRGRRPGPPRGEQNGGGPDGAGQDDGPPPRGQNGGPPPRRPAGPPPEEN
ncbi:MAG: hypothetical protein K8T25_13365 [Planctomycetia bacterium]|nr:hypothetical protein [Planctomycetia bacterium]